MYKIKADNTLIYDSTLEDYKINKGSITLETNKSGSFNFSIYPDHFYYDRFIRLKTVITAYKDEKIAFRGRVINDTSDYWNNKALTCEGELGFFQDSIIRPFSFSGTPEELLNLIINRHNSQVDDFKKFKLGKVTVTGKVVLEITDYTKSLDFINKQLVEVCGGYLYITHGADGKDEIPTLNYLADFTTVATQKIEFGSNLKNYTKKVTADSIVTAIIPIGAEVVVGTEKDEDGNEVEIKARLNINDVNNGIDYVYNAEAVKEYGWIFAPVEWKEIANANLLKTTAENYVKNSSLLNVTIELTAIDLHLLDRSIESYKLGDYIPVISEPHNYNAVLLCTKQTIDLLNPGNDSITLGHNYATFTERTNKINSTFNNISAIQATVNRVSSTVGGVTVNTQQIAETVANNYNEVTSELSTIRGDNEAIASAVTQNAQNIAINAQNIASIIARLEVLENAGGV